MTDWLHDWDFTTTLTFLRRDINGNSAWYFTDEPNRESHVDRFMMCRTGVAAELGVEPRSIPHGFCIDVRISEQPFPGSKEFKLEEMADEVASSWQYEVAAFWDASDFMDMACDGWNVMYYAIRQALCETPECMNFRPSWRQGICKDCQEIEYENRERQPF